MKIISYSLFGYGKERQASSFDFPSYLRGLLINIRCSRLIYPDWKIVLHLDQSTYDGFKDLFDKLPIIIEICEDAPLTKAMLWRLKPLFAIDERQNKIYSHVLCRDLDSPPTYREAQAVTYWMNRDKAAHAITDSVSHNLPMLGGMIGFQPKYFTMLTGYDSWDKMFDGLSINFARKGADQDFLNKFIYPKFAQQGKESITQHYVLGMPNTFLNDCHNHIQDLELNIPYSMKESNETCGHIGSAGAYMTSLTNFLFKHRHQFEDIREIENDFSDIFYWIKDNSF